MSKEIDYVMSCIQEWGKPNAWAPKCFSMYYYYPVSCDIQGDDEIWEIRNLIWNFKANPPRNKEKSIDEIMLLHEEAVERIVCDMEMCLDSFFRSNVSKLTLVCIPSSKREVYQRRYEDFSEDICRRTGMHNGYQYVRIRRDGEAKHTGGRKEAQVYIDKNFFRGRLVLLFDDIITTGDSMTRFKEKMERAGATVIGGFSIGRTVHELQYCNPIDDII